MNENNPSRRIHILRDSVSRLIAAGEVIERPASVVRELLDNSIDSGASRVEVHLEGGGITGIRVVDDGSGMGPEDLELCPQAHATSKIHQLSDLDSLSSLGFRGEALSSIAACSKLTITSSVDGGEAHFITLHGGDKVSSGLRAGNRGTIVDVSDLFYSMPARKKFLKRPASETGLCTRVFLDKASAFPDRAFKLVSEGTGRHLLEPSDLKGRLEAIHGTEYNLHLIESEHPDFSLRIMAGDPGRLRRDRRLLQVFVNRRRVYEYGLMQALEYGYSAFTPGGYHPVGFLFIDIDPVLVDFNIHPAKREVRFKNLPEVHRAVTTALQGGLDNRSSEGGSYARSPEGYSFPGLAEASAPAYRGGGTGGSPLDTWSGLEPVSSLSVPDRPYRYLGQIFGVFLLVEMDERLLFIDQHAAHERMVYNDLLKKGSMKQELLVPCRFETEDDEYLNDMTGSLAALGITLERIAPGVWHLLTVPSGCRDYDEGITDFLVNLRGSAENLAEGLYSTIACKAAVKEGAFLDAHAAASIIDAVLAMERPRCPHGRPIVFTLTRDYLYRQVKRT